MNGSFQKEGMIHQVLAEVDAMPGDSFEERLHGYATLVERETPSLQGPNWSTLMELVVLLRYLCRFQQFPLELLPKAPQMAAAE